MTRNTTVLITGANRGIGEGLLAVFLARPNVTAIAAVRNPAKADGLKKLPAGEGSELIVVKLDNVCETDAGDAINVLKSEYHITHLDIVIANAGIARYIHPVASIPISEIVDHHRTNTVGAILLLQATETLMRAAEAPKFVAISSSMGSMSAMPHHAQPSVAYGSSKAALNYVMCKLHAELEYLCAFPLHPGWVQTDMGNAGAIQNGFEKADTPIDISVAGLVDKIDRATRENSGGKFVTWDDSPLDW